MIYSYNQSVVLFVNKIVFHGPHFLHMQNNAHVRSTDSVYTQTRRGKPHHGPDREATLPNQAIGHTTTDQRGHTPKPSNWPHHHRPERSHSLTKQLATLPHTREVTLPNQATPPPTREVTLPNQATAGHTSTDQTRRGKPHHGPDREVTLPNQAIGHTSTDQRGYTP